MNPATPENDHLMSLVAKLDPAPATPPAAAKAHKQDLFDQLMGADEHRAPVEILESRLSPNEHSPRRRFALPGAIAAALIVIAAVLLTLSRPPSVEATLVAAAEQSALATSGRAEIVIDLRAAPALVVDPDETPNFQLAFVFDDDDYRLDTVIDGVIVVSELRVDDVSYVGNVFGSEDGFAGENLRWTVTTGERFPFDQFGSVAADDAGPDSVLPLVELAKDFERIETDRGAVYSGTISRAELLDQEELPAGVAIVTSGADPAAGLPETLVLDVEVIDGLVDKIELLVEGDLPNGDYIDATVTTSYFDYGQPQNLQAPAVLEPPLATAIDVAEASADAVTVAPGAALPLWAPGPEPQTDDHLVLAEVLGRRPQLCFEAGILDTTEPGAPPSFTLIQSAIVDCFLLAGEPAAAEAVGNILSG